MTLRADRTTLSRWRRITMTRRCHLAGQYMQFCIYVIEWTHNDLRFNFIRCWLKFSFRFQQAARWRRSSFCWRKARRSARRSTDRQSWSRQSTGTDWTSWSTWSATPASWDWTFDSGTRRAAMSCFIRPPLGIRRSSTVCWRLDATWRTTRTTGRCSCSRHWAGTWRWSSTWPPTPRSSVWSWNRWTVTAGMLCFTGNYVIL